MKMELKVEEMYETKKAEKLDMPKVYIILLNWNGWRDTIDCLQSLKQVTYPDFHVVIVDNASSDGSVEKIRAWAVEEGIPTSEYILKSRNALPEQIVESVYNKQGLRGIELIHSTVNLGFCAGNNVGMEFASRAGADYFLILNNDTICEPNFLEPLVDVAESADNVGLVGGLICYADDPNTIWWAGGKFDKWLNAKKMLTGKHISSVSNGVTEVGLITGCMMLMSINVWKNVGGFDEKFFIWSEDWDLSLRIRKKGCKLLFVKESKILHKVSSSLGYFSPKAYYYGTRNSLILRKKHLNSFQSLIHLIYFLSSRILRYGYFIIKGRLDLVQAGICGIRDYFLGRTGRWENHKD